MWFNLDQRASCCLETATDGSLNVNTCKAHHPPQPPPAQSDFHEQQPAIILYLNTNVAVKEKLCSVYSALEKRYIEPVHLPFITV